MDHPGQMICHRCKKELKIGEVGFDVTGVMRLFRDGPDRFTKGPYSYVNRVTTYHKRCLPPNLFHRVAGSQPASQSSVN